MSDLNNDINNELNQDKKWLKMPPYVHSHLRDHSLRDGADVADTVGNV